MSREKRGRLRMGSTKRRVTVRRTRPGLPDRRPGAQEVIARAHRLARILKLLRTELREVTPSQSKPRGLPAIATGSPRSWRSQTLPLRVHAPERATTNG